MQNLTRLLGLSLLAALPLAAQSFTAQISGVARDSAGALVAGAAVKMTNLDTGVAQSASTNEAGIYRILDLRPGRYRLEVSLAGFKKYVREPLTLQVADRISLDAVLEVGELATEVTVTAEAAPLIETGTADFSQLVDRQKMEELPIESRNVLHLAALTPGFVEGVNFDNQTQAPNFFASDFKIGGSRSLTHEVLLDGAPSSGPDRGYGQFVPPVDSTQEYKVLGNAFSAEYGRTSGAVINMVTKSGSNQYHGVGYIFSRESIFDANNFFANRAGMEKPEFGRHQIGGNIGGPLVRNRTFFFADFDSWRMTQPSFMLSTVPTPLQLEGDFSQTYTLNPGQQLIRIFDPLTVAPNGSGGYVRQAFPGNVIPRARMDPVAVEALKFYPAPNLPGDPVTQANNYISNSPNYDNRYTYEGKIDHYLRVKHRLSARFSQMKFNRNNPPAWPGPSARLSRDGRGAFTNIVVGDVSTLTPSLVLEIRASLSRAHDGFYPVSEGFDLRTLKFPEYFVKAAGAYFPTFTINDVSPMGQQNPLDFARNTYALSATINKQSGAHSVKTGFDVRRLQFHPFQINHPAGQFTFNRGMTQSNPFAGNRLQGFGLASFLLGAGASGNLANDFRPALGRHYYAGFVQDDWKITPGITLNLGLRYDVERGPTERFNRMGYLDLGAPSPLAAQTGLSHLRGVPRFVTPDDRTLLHTDKNNFAPRAGLTARLGEKTVARLGYGIFFVPMTIVQSQGWVGFSTSTPWLTTEDGGITIADRLSDPFPKGFVQPTNNPGPLAQLGQALDSTLRDERVGYTQQWSVSFQREVARGLAAEVAYWGNKGTKLQFGAGIQENYLPNSYLALGTALYDQVENPFFGLIGVGTLSNPTVARRQLLLTYPQYTSVLRIVPMAASSIYHAVTFRLERRFSSLSVQGNYTIGKCIDDSSSQEGNYAGAPVDHQNRGLERSVSVFDVPQRLVGSGNWTLPFGRGKRFGDGFNPVLNAMLGNWTLAGIATFQSGVPVYVGRPHNTGQSARLDNPTIDRWFDTSVFAPVSAFAIGDTGRVLPDVRKDGLINFNMSLAKGFRLSERFALRLRGEFFNVFNTPSFGMPVNGVSNAAFGVVNSQANKPRSVQLGARVTW